MTSIVRRLPPVLLSALFVLSSASIARADECRYGEWTTYEDVSLSRLPDGSAYFYQTSNTAIDADGAPNAYNPGNTGLDFNANAGLPDHWHNVLAADPHDPEQPFVQTQGQFAGNYVTRTSLLNPSGEATDPQTYVDAQSIPYLVFPGNFYRMSGTGRMGDLGVAFNRDTERSSSFIVADLGNDERWTGRNVRRAGPGAERQQPGQSAHRCRRAAGRHALHCLPLFIQNPSLAMAAHARGDRSRCPGAIGCRRRVGGGASLPLAFLPSLHQPQQTVQRPIGHAELVQMAHGVERGSPDCCR